MTTIWDRQYDIHIYNQAKNLFTAVAFIFVTPYSPYTYGITESRIIFAMRRQMKIRQP